MAKEQKDLKDGGAGQGQGHSITVSFNGNPKTLRQGRYLVSELKAALGVEAGYELDQIVDGQAKTLNDSDHVNIKEDDVFVSHVPRGSSS